MTHYHCKIKLPPHSIHSPIIKYNWFYLFLTMNYSRKLRPTDQKEPTWILPGTVQGQWVKKNGCWEGYKSTLPAPLLIICTTTWHPASVFVDFAPFTPSTEEDFRTQQQITMLHSIPSILNPSNVLPWKVRFSN